MDIRIKQLKLENFKGVRAGVFDFDGRNVLIEGENGTGKSTIFDAFTWLLFGKDHNGNDQTNFDIKTLDPETMQPIERLDHSVEAVLLVDGCAKTLKRIWRENWTKPKGETEQVMKGHVTLFFVDGVDVVTKKAYDSVIHEWIDESVFKLITDPLFFIGDRTPWKVRREVLLGLVAGEVDRENLKAEFADLLAEMNGDNMETFRKRISAAKKANKTRLDEEETKIKAYLETMPEPVDVTAERAKLKEMEAELEKELKAPRLKLEKADKKIMDVNERQSAKADALKAIFAQINALQLKQGEFIDQRTKAAQEANLKRSRDIMDAKEKVNGYDSEIRVIATELQRLTTRQRGLQADRATLADNLRALGEKYNAEKSKAFTYEPSTKCHACGQDLPAETIEDAIRQAREAYLAEQKNAVTAIYNKSLRIKEDIKAIDSNLEAVALSFRDAEMRRDVAQENLMGARVELEKLASIPENNISQLRAALMLEGGFIDLENEISELKKKANELYSTDDEIKAIEAEKKAAYDEIRRLSDASTAATRDIYARIVRAEQRDSIQTKVDLAESHIKTLAAEIANLENLEFMALNYIRADVQAQEAAINRLFNVARWKMFDTTLDGGIVETCEVMTKAGASFGSMNDAAKIQCGMDVIRVLNGKYNAAATIFVDNAESITQRRFDTEAQVIRLKVREGADELTITNE